MSPRLPATLLTALLRHRLPATSSPTQLPASLPFFTMIVQLAFLRRRPASMPPACLYVAGACLFVIAIVAVIIIVIIVTVIIIIIVMVHRHSLWSIYLSILCDLDFSSFVKFIFPFSSSKCAFEVCDISVLLLHFKL
jgi:hypothetical protein